MKDTILIIEDNVELAKTLKSTLHAHHRRINTVHSLESAYSFLDRRSCDLAIVDRVLPDGDGLELAEYLRDISFHSRILCVSEKASVEERIKGLEAGADDYLAKPFSLAELALKVQKLLAHEKRVTSEYLQAGGVTLRVSDGLLQYENQRVTLRKKECQILSCLFRHKNTIVSREMLVDMVWGNSGITPLTITLDVYIRRLRILLKERSQIIKTFRGFGYSVVDHPEGVL